MSYDESYILVTAARNEAAHLASTIEAVTAQSIRPKKWIIVSDGSTDETDSIIQRYSANYPFIELLRVDPKEERNFGSKALAVNAGYQHISHLPHEFVGVLDADITFDKNYYASVMEQFDRNPELGIAGGVLVDIVDGEPVPQITDPAWSVSGPVQMFRKECFEAIGGYMPIRGGIDAAAEVMARMNGWQVQAFPEITGQHHRQTGTENHTQLGVFYYRGIEDYRLGYHPLFFTARSIRRFKEHPYIVGGIIMLTGYFLSVLRRTPKKVPPKFVHYLRTEQMQRLYDCIRRRKD